MKTLIFACLFLVNLFALSNEEKRALNYMYQEEKLAKDVYYELSKIYTDINVFSIYNSEIKHKAGVKNVMEHYGLSLPVVSDKTGVFKNPELQSQYDVLMKKARKSLKDALEVAIMIEVTDVEDLNNFLNEAASPDIVALFEFLRAGSYNHYNAFNRTLIGIFGKGACELMDGKWCKNYPFKRGVGRYYRNWYWFSWK